MEMETLRFLGAGSCLLLSLKVFDWLRLFDSTAFIVALTIQTLYDIVVFAGLMIMVILCLGFPMRMIEFNYVDSTEYNFITDFKDIAVEQYLIIVGEFPLESWGNLDDWTKK